MCSGRGRWGVGAVSAPHFCILLLPHTNTTDARAHWCITTSVSGLCTTVLHGPTSTPPPHLRGAADTASFSITSTRNLSEAARGEQLPLDV